MMKTVLVGDIGGTKTTIGLVRLSKKPELLFVHQENTSEIKDFGELIIYALQTAKKDHRLSVSEACFAVAGPIINQKVKMSNAHLVLDAKQLKNQTKLKKIVLMNDFEAIGHAINVISKEDMKTIHGVRPVDKKVCAILGSGTGLGKCILHWDGTKYSPMASEGGHVEFPFTDEERELMHFFKQKRGIHGVTQNAVLSGKGLEWVYEYLQKTSYKKEKKGLTAEQISKTRTTNLCSKTTFELYTQFYARACKNFAFETLPYGGFYIAGGIAQKNPELFGKAFYKIFSQERSEKYRKVVVNIPLHLITNPYIALLGAAYALR